MITAIRRILIFLHVDFDHLVNRQSTYVADFVFTKHQVFCISVYV